MATHHGSGLLSVPSMGTHSCASTSPVATLHEGTALATQYLRTLSAENICPILILLALVYACVSKFVQTAYFAKLIFFLVARRINQLPHPLNYDIRSFLTQEMLFCSVWFLTSFIMLFLGSWDGCQDPSGKSSGTGRNFNILWKAWSQSTRRIWTSRRQEIILTVTWRK